MLEQAARDWLTDFLLKESLNPFIDELISDCRLNKKKFAIALVDVDHLKRFNDKYGHACGDQLLRYAANTIYMTFCKERCYFFRYGGDEFILVFPDERTRDVIGMFKQCTQNFFIHPFMFKNKTFRVTTSSGIAVYPDNGETAEELIRKADDAMYVSKHFGRNNIILAGKVGYLKFLRFIIITGCLFILAVSGYAVYRAFFKEMIPPAVTQLKEIKITTGPALPVAEDLDEVVLRSGRVIRGRIVKEDPERVIVRLYLEKGEASMAVNRKDILVVRYKAKPKASK